jgi:hypothetical protein
MPGTVFCIPDDLSHGPLDDGRARAEYLRACYEGYDEWPSDVTDAFAPWREMIERLDDERPQAVYIWSGDNVSERVFLAMASWRLTGRPESVLHVALPGTDGRHYVAAYTPAELADQFALSRELTGAERAALAEDSERIRDETGLLRRWEDGQIIGVPVDRHDPWLMDACTTDWTHAPRIVGMVMGWCGERNPLSDLFFSSRLQTLINSGRLEADGPRRRLRDYAVRLAAM